MKGRLQIKRGSKGLAIALAIIIGLICLASAITGVFFRDYYYLAQKEQIRNPEKFQEYKKKRSYVYVYMFRFSYIWNYNSTFNKLYVFLYIKISSKTSLSICI